MNRVVYAEEQQVFFSDLAENRFMDKMVTEARRHFDPSPQEIKSWEKIDYASFLKLAKETFADDIRKLDEELAEIYGNGDDNGE